MASHPLLTPPMSPEDSQRLSSNYSQRGCTTWEAIQGIGKFYKAEMGLWSAKGKEHQFKQLPQVVEEEKEFIENARKLRKESGVAGLREGEKFSVAFSGGGIRAAAFQAGVLWQLAEMGKLQDVEYLSAVSGGSYIQTAFATHCMDKNDQPQKHEDINAWYKKVVGQTIVQMQENAGNFIRDCFAIPHYDKSSARCPRWTDTLVLIGMIFYTISVNPTVIMLCLGVPLVNITNTFYGSALRAAFCADIEDWQGVFQEMIDIDLLLKMAGLMFAITLIAMVLSRFLKKPAPWVDRQKQKPDISRPLQFQRSLYFVGTRCLCIVLVFIVWLYAIAWYERALFDEADPSVHRPSKASLCCKYMSFKTFAPNCGTDETCTTFVDSCPDVFTGNEDLSWSRFNEHLNKEDICLKALNTGTRKQNPSVLDKLAHFERKVISSGYFWLPLLVVIVVLAFAGVLLIPFFGPGIAMNVLFVAGPLFAFAASVSAATIPIFGPITSGAGNRTVNFATFHSISKIGFIAAMIVAPLYETFRNLFHVFYARVLCSNYFKDGRNPSLRNLGYHKEKDKEGNVRDEIHYPWAPFIIFTGTCSDYQAAGDTDSIAEISFSPLHIGSEETDFIKTQHWFRMATGTALSGAGCVDGIGLAMSDLISLRFWLELLNLSWGDFIVFDGHTHAQKSTDWVSSEKMGETNEKLPAFMRLSQDALIRMLFRLPSMLVLFAIFFSFLHGYTMSGDCDRTKTTYHFGLLTFLVIAVASLFDFEPFTPFARFMTMSPFIRQLHQLLKFTFSGHHPPPMLYVTDGGVQDCTTVGLLMKRRVERILLISCGQDPQCKMGNFKDAMKKAQEHNLGGFYVPEDPRKEVWVRLADFQASTHETTLHIGIRYPEVKDDATGKVIHETSHGHLLIVKNKLPHVLFEEAKKNVVVPTINGTTTQTIRPVLPPITVDEVKTGIISAKDEEFVKYWGAMTQDQLGSGGCCDCCHVSQKAPWLNCCNKWPQGFFGNYLYLSPMFASSLMRLGHELSRGPIQSISESRTLSEQWEHYVVAKK